MLPLAMQPWVNSVGTNVNRCRRCSRYPFDLESLLIMNTKTLAALGLTTLLNLGSVTAVNWVQAPARAQKTVNVLKKGTFVGAAPKRVEGTAFIFTYNGGRFLFLDRKFQSGEGPDLFVLLHQQAVPNSYQDNYQNLGRLQKVNGRQWYEIPPEVNLNEAQSVVVWCRQFNVTFGYATLGN